MSLRTGLLRAARLARIPNPRPPRLPLSLFIRATHDASTSTTSLEQFLQPLRYPDEPNAVRRHYLPLIAELERLSAEPSSSPLPPLLTRTQLITIMDLLATSGRPPDLKCIRDMFSHLPSYFDVAITPELHSVVISALLRQGYVFIAQQWITQIPELPPYVAPALDNFHTFLKACPNHVEHSVLRGLILKMRRAGVRPTNETFAILIRCIINNATVAKTSVSPDTFNTIIADMKTHRLAADPDILALMSDHYMEHGLQAAAESIRQNYAIHFPDMSTPEEEQKEGWKKQLAAAAHASGISHSLEVFRGLAAQGCAATPDTVRAMLSASKSVDDIRTVEEALGFRADAPDYAVVVNNNIRVGQVQDALTVYEEAKKSGIIPVAGLVGPIIRSLVSRGRKPTAAHNADLDTALALYSDIDEAFPPPDVSAVNSHSEHANGPDIDIYTSLLRGLSLSSNIKGAYTIAEAMFADMKVRGITVTAAIKASHLILEMRGAESLDEAFRRYRKSRAELTEGAYPVVLHAFSTLSRTFGPAYVLEYYLQMVGDMRQAGFKISERIYTDILHQFAELGTLRRMQWRNSEESQRYPSRPMPPQMFDDLLADVRQIHDLVSLDTSIQLERTVWNQLMDTYQRLGNFPEAYRVWETMFLSNKYGPVAVSIILDACGYAGQHETARRIVDKLVDTNYVLNLHNWNSYVECLCRANQMSDALRVICKEMGTAAQPVKADASTLTIMLKLADTRIQTNIILTQVRRNLPELWASLPERMDPRPDNVERPP
ncbi:hypothetical protein B0H19DRAFT_1128082 [Mycena capillaripes]|nr:hypothetical protein B0H19DRAFT_1128082 [Mycena capillaripes]